jgi:hypothetical protein
VPPRMPPLPGVSVASVAVNASRYLMVTLTDGSTHNAGLVPVTPGATGATGADGVSGAMGATGATGAKGADGTPRRVDLYTAAAGAFTFPTPYAAPPVIVPLPGWSAQQMIIASASAITTTGCTIAVTRSKGTLLLASGPFEAAPAGTTASFVAIA